MITRVSIFLLALVAIACHDSDNKKTGCNVESPSCSKYFLAEFAPPDVTPIQFYYDSNGRLLTTITDASSRTTYYYGGNGALVQHIYTVNDVEVSRRRYHFDNDRVTASVLVQPDEPIDSTVYSYDTQSRIVQTEVYNFGDSTNRGKRTYYTYVDDNTVTAYVYLFDRNKPIPPPAESQRSTIQYQLDTHPAPFPKEYTYNHGSGSVTLFGRLYTKVILHSPTLGDRSNDYEIIYNPDGYATCFSGSTFKYACEGPME